MHFQNHNPQKALVVQNSNDSSPKYLKHKMDPEKPSILIDKNTITHKTENMARLISEEVQSSPVLISLYLEFKKIISNYDQDVVKTLTPLMVNVLDSINKAYQLNKEYGFKLQILEEDNKQLEEQCENAKTLKIATEKEFLSYKKTSEWDRTELTNRVEILQSKVYLLELRHKNIMEYARVIEESEREVQMGYDQLYSKYIDLFRAYVIYSERTQLPQLLEKDLMILKEYLKNKALKEPDSMSVISAQSDVSNDKAEQKDFQIPDKEELINREKEFREVWFDLEEKSSVVVTTETPSILIPKLKKRIADLQQELRMYRKNNKDRCISGDEDNLKIISKFNMNSKGIYTKADIARYLIIKNHFYMGVQESLQWSQLLDSAHWTINNIKYCPVTVTEEDKGS